MKKFITLLTDLNNKFLDWGYRRYSSRKQKIEIEVAKIVISNIGTSAFWLGVSICAQSCYWLFTMMTLVPVYCYYQLAKAGMVWRQPITVWSFLISAILYFISFFIQLSKTDLGIPSYVFNP